jgi:XRE family transcriptional regulator, regulator of sulfur utilization
MAAKSLEQTVKMRIRNLRIERGLTQEQLCEKAGISVDAVTRIEGGSRVPTLDTLARLAGGLNVAVTDLVAGADTVNKPAGPATKLVALLEDESREVQTAVLEVAKTVLRALQLPRRSRGRS